jgi:hypothetical protein
MKEGELDGFDLSVAKSTGLIKQLNEPPSEAFEKMLPFAGPALVVFFLACSILSNIPEPPFFKSVWPQLVWIVGVALLVLIPVIVTLTIQKAGPAVLAFLAQGFSLVIILAIGLGLPALTIYFFGEGKALLAQPSAQLFARLLQLGFIGTASLLPVLLFPF